MPNDKPNAGTPLDVEGLARQFARFEMLAYMTSPKAWAQGGIPLPFFTEDKAVEMLAAFGKSIESPLASRLATLEQRLEAIRHPKYYKGAYLGDGKCPKYCPECDGTCFISAKKDLVCLHCANMQDLDAALTRAEKAEAALAAAKNLEGGHEK